MDKVGCHSVAVEFLAVALDGRSPPKQHSGQNRERFAIEKTHPLQKKQRCAIHDFRVRNHAWFVDKLREIHHNSAKRRLCEPGRLGVEQLPPMGLAWDAF